MRRSLPVACRVMTTLNELNLSAAAERIGPHGFCNNRSRWFASKSSSSRLFLSGKPRLTNDDYRHQGRRAQPNIQGAASSLLPFQQKIESPKKRHIKGALCYTPPEHRLAFLISPLCLHSLILKSGIQYRRSVGVSAMYNIGGLFSKYLHF